MLLLFTVRKPGLAKYLLVLATLTSVLWALSQITQFVGPLVIGNILLADSFKYLIWTVFLAACLKQDFSTLGQVFSRPASWVMLALPLASVLLPFILPLPLTYSYLLQTTIALQILVILELIYRQSGSERWSFKPLVLFLGATNLFDFVMYANATMVGQLEPFYIAARGYIYVALLPLLVLAIRRIQQWGLDIFVSREVVLHSSLLLVAGAYLFVMAMAGYLIKYIGGQWSTTIQAVLVALSLTLLATLFLSNHFRTKVKVFITKHFFANQFDYRIEWLKLSQQLSQTEDNSQSDVYQASLTGLLNAIGYNHGILFSVQQGHREIVANLGHQQIDADDERTLDQLQAFLTHQHWLIDMHEMRYQPYNYEGLKLSPEQVERCQFQLVLPLYRESTLWGIAVMSAGDGELRQLNWELRDYLTAVTAQVANYIFHYEAAKEVAENAQFAAFSRMSAFVLHDLKNVLAQIDLILTNAEQHKNNPEFIEDTFETLQHTKTRMQKMLSQLTEKHDDAKSKQSLCDVAVLAERVVSQRCATLKPYPNVKILQNQAIVVDEDKLSNVLYHLISNAQQATTDDGDVTVQIDVSADNQWLMVSIIDNGVGMSEQFIAERLFKPFDTTKGNAGMGIGAYDARNFMQRIGGRLEVDSKEGEGSTFTLYFPID